VILVSVYVVIAVSYKIMECYGYLIHCNEIEGYLPSGHCLYVHFSHLLVHGLTRSNFSSKKQNISIFHISERSVLISLV